MMVQRYLGQNMIYWIGEVIDVNDPHQSGRVKIRVYGHHDDRTNIPDSALPWAQVTQSPTSAAIGRIGSAPVGLVVGSRVVGFWADSSDLQYPLVIGSMGKAGDPINGQMLNGSPAIDTSLGSIPQSSSGNPNNPYSTLNDSRVSVSDIDSGSANVTSVSSNTGGYLQLLLNHLWLILDYQQLLHIIKIVITMFWILLMRLIRLVHYLRSLV
jgi:hypothetical protein